MRNIILLCAVVAVLAFFVHWTGRAAGRAQCEKSTAVQAVATQTQTETLRKKINDKSNTTAVGDIRRWLRDHYTIGD